MAVYLYNYMTHSFFQVYCRVRPLKQDENESCAEVIGMNILQLTPPVCSLAYKSGHRNGVSTLSIAIDTILTLRALMSHTCICDI